MVSFHDSEGFDADWFEELVRDKIAAIVAAGELPVFAQHIDGLTSHAADVAADAAALGAWFNRSQGLYPGPDQGDAGTGEEEVESLAESIRGLMVWLDWMLDTPAAGPEVN